MIFEHDGTPGFLAGVFPNLDGTVSIIFDSSTETDHVATLGAITINESAHHDGRVGKSEEIVSSVVEALSHIRNLRMDPSLANLGTELTRGANGRLITLLNSGSRGDAIGLHEAPLRGAQQPIWNLQHG